jgi:hypothetical protein
MRPACVAEAEDAVPQRGCPRSPGLRRCVGLLLSSAQTGSEVGSRGLSQQKLPW